MRAFELDSITYAVLNVLPFLAGFSMKKKAITVHLIWNDGLGKGRVTNLHLLDYLQIRSCLLQYAHMHFIH